MDAVCADGMDYAQKRPLSKTCIITIPKQCACNNTSIIITIVMGD